MYSEVTYNTGIDFIASSLTVTVTQLPANCNQIIIIIIILGQCLWCCHHDNVIAKAQSVHLMNVEQCQAAANRPSDQANRPGL